MANFGLIFNAALLVCCVFTFLASDIFKKYVSKQGGGNSDNEISPETKQVHQSLLRRYMLVYLSATLSDWFQGPYVYALYMDYGYTSREIAELFVAGFGSSMIFGSFVGGMADMGGRRNFVFIFVVVYIASCTTKHVNNYWVLMLGRLLGGVSTSLLFSVFEAWLIRAHSDADLPKVLLSKSFSWAAFGNSVIAIVAGLVANVAVGDSKMSELSSPLYYGGLLNPFDLAILALIVCGVGAGALWEENYGEPGEAPSESRQGNKANVKWYSALKDALITSSRNTEVMLCGIISSLFEGSMYIFVFMWTPLLKSFHEDALPMGLIFATFMVSCMTGSSVFSMAVEKYAVESLAIAVFTVGALAMLIVALEFSATASSVGMNLFEMCVGMYFPIMGTMKGSIVPECKRAAIYNLYRIPLNFIVLTCLLTNPQPTTAFVMNSIMLGLATLLQVILAKRRFGSNGVTEVSRLENTPLMEHLNEDIEAAK
eukprot:Nitzschia sp. Nitz4//scaffold19_size178191//109793//111323//NITZ4_001990-RA/size178191-processed-gene-0.74-mRNA-1//-1//CDS//3329540720//6684//frame0